MSGMWRTVGSLCISASLAVSLSVVLMLDAVEMLLVRGKDLVMDWARSLLALSVLASSLLTVLNLLAWKLAFPWRGSEVTGWTLWDRKFLRDLSLSPSSWSLRADTEAGGLCDHSGWVPGSPQFDLAWFPSSFEILLLAYVGCSWIKCQLLLKSHDFNLKHNKHF